MSGATDAVVLENGSAMLDIVRTSLHRALTTPAGDRFFPVRVPKDLARRMNAMLGEPLCSRAELDRRRAGRAKLEALKGARSGAAASAPSTQAPVMVYFEEDRRTHMHGLDRICAMLDDKGIAYSLLDVSCDEVMKGFVLREAKRKDGEMPIVFVAGAPVGGHRELVEWDTSGRLAAALAGR